MFLIEVLKVAIGLLMEAHQNRHYFTEAQGTATSPVLHAMAEQRGVPLGFKGLAEIINVAEKRF